LYMIVLLHGGKADGVFAIVRCCGRMLRFIGVSGFFISCATCFAISLQALSLSVFASFTALSSSCAIMLLYSFTRLPISSFSPQLIGSFVFPSVILLNRC